MIIAELAARFLGPHNEPRERVSIIFEHGGEFPVSEGDKYFIHLREEQKGKLFEVKAVYVVDDILPFAGVWDNFYEVAFTLVRDDGVAK